MPLTMKKMGTRKPKPMASSLVRTTWLSSPSVKRRTTIPAANAPSSTSSPSSKAR